MALILRGKRRGEQLGISQWANDWVSLEDGSIVNPTNLQLDINEMALFEKMRGQSHIGDFFSYFYINEEGYIKKRV